jgi:drug/metabolite transporter (DMT)-like permease
MTFISGMLGVFIPAFLFAYAQTKLNPAVTGILNALTPIFTLLIAVLFFQQKAVYMKWVGMAVGFVGSVLLTLSSSEKGGFELTIYPFLIILATICYGLNANLSKKFMQGISPIYLTAMSQSFIAVLALVVALNSSLSEQWNTEVASKVVQAGWLGVNMELRWYSLLCLVFLGISSTAVAMILFNKLMAITSVIFASSVTYLIPLVAMAWAMLDGIYLTYLQGACMLLIIGGVYIANKSK